MCLGTRCRKEKKQMPKIEITATNDFSDNDYKAALEQAKRRMDNLEAERDKAVSEAKQLLEKLREINNENAELRTRNRMLFESNSAFQAELVHVKEELTKANDALSKTDDYRDHYGDDEDEIDDEDDEEECCGNCAVCDHPISEDTEVDKTIDYLIRENLDYEGQLKAYRDVIYIMCSWLKADVSKHV